VAVTASLYRCKHKKKENTLNPKAIKERDTAMARAEQETQEKACKRAHGKDQRDNETGHAPLTLRQGSLWHRVWCRIDVRWSSVARAEHVIGW
jgi:hypothetical protein